MPTHFEIVKHEKPKLPKVKMTCDTVIDPKLEQIPAIEACFAKNNFSLISASMGAGKTSFVIQMLKGVFKGCYENIYLFMPEQSFNSIPDKDKTYLRKHLVDEEGEPTIYHEFDEDKLTELYSKLEDNSNNKYNSLIVIDDYGAEFKRKPIEMSLKRICLKNRHLKSTIWLLCQNYYMLPKNMREICNNIILFNTNKSQNQKLFKEQLDINEDEFNELLRLLKTRHDYMIINLNYKRIFVDWQEIIFKKDL